MSDSRPIGIFDSGIGGLSVVRHVLAELPQEHLIYIADQHHVPYGPRPADEILRFSDGITRFLLTQNVKQIVVACNTATAAALTELRRRYPDIDFVGMEPAVKPAANLTQSGKVGVLATAGTFQSQRYAFLMERYASHVQIFENPCVGLVDLIEAGKGDAPETAVLLQTVLTPMLQAGADTIVLGCTHYPFVAGQIRSITGEQVHLIDPAPAIVRQMQRLLKANGQFAAPTQSGKTRFITTGSPYLLGQVLPQWLGIEADIETAVWQHNQLHTAT